MSNIEEDYNLFQLVKRNPINSCIDLSKNMIGKKRGVFYFTERFRIDFENKMSDFERLKAEQEQDKKRIKELEEERQLVGMPVKNKRDGRIGVVLHQWESGSVAVLENINPRIINTHDNWSTLEILTDEVKQTQTKCDSIPVQKVKDLIEDVKKI